MNNDLLGHRPANLIHFGSSPPNSTAASGLAAYRLPSAGPPHACKLIDKLLHPVFGFPPGHEAFVVMADIHFCSSFLRQG